MAELPTRPHHAFLKLREYWRDRLLTGRVTTCDTTVMRKRSRNEDWNTAAFRVVQQATGQAPKDDANEPHKNPAAVALGRAGGLKGGKARAESMTAKQRSASARKAAQARWGKH